MHKTTLFRGWLDPFSDKTYQRFGSVVMTYLIVSIMNLLWFMGRDFLVDLPHRWRLAVLFLLHLGSYASVFVMSAFWGKSARFTRWLVALWIGMALMLLSLFFSPYLWLTGTCVVIWLVFSFTYLLMQCWIGSGRLEKWLDRQAGMQAVSLIAWIVSLNLDDSWLYVGFIGNIPPLITLYSILQQVRRLLALQQLEAKFLRLGEVPESDGPEEKP